jgi:hypothetical protein
LNDSLTTVSPDFDASFWRKLLPDFSIDCPATSSISIPTLASSTDPVECPFDPIIVVVLIVLVFANLLVPDADLDISFWRDVFPDFSTDCPAAADFYIDCPATDASRSIPTLSLSTGPVACPFDPIIVKIVLVVANLLVPDADLDAFFWREFFPDFSIDCPATDASRSIPTLSSSTDPVACPFDPIIELVLVFANLLVPDADLDAFFWRELFPDFSIDCPATDADFSIDCPTTGASTDPVECPFDTIIVLVLVFANLLVPDADLDGFFWRDLLPDFTANCPATNADGSSRFKPTLSSSTLVGCPLSSLYLLLVLVLVCANLLVFVLLPDFSTEFLTTGTVVSSRFIPSSALSSTTPGSPVGGSPSSSNPIVMGTT